jgi:hypothetical protein
VDAQGRPIAYRVYRSAARGSKLALLSDTHLYVTDLQESL